MRNLYCMRYAATSYTAILGANTNMPSGVCTERGTKTGIAANNILY